MGGRLLLGSVRPYTFYQEFALSRPAALWIDARGPAEPRRYFAVSQAFAAAERQAQASQRDLQEHVRAALRDSVRHHLVADVPVGVFLSAGIDSGSLLGLMRDVGQQDIQAITLTYEDYRNKHEDEAPLAELVAAHYGSRHATRVVPEAEFRADLPKIFEAMDQPTIDGINTWFVSGCGPREPASRRQFRVSAATSYSAVIPRSMGNSLGALGRGPLGFRSWDAVRHLVSGARRLVSSIHPKTAGWLKYAGTMREPIYCGARRVHAVDLAEGDGSAVHG